MSKARASFMRTGAVHAALIAYTLIALFPVFLTIVNSFKSRNAIFREPLAVPTPETFSLIGYETVLKQGDFIGYFQNSIIVTVVSIALVLLFGAMAAFALSEYRFRGNTLMGLYLALGIMILAPAEATKTVTLGSQIFIGQFVTNWNAVLSALSLAIFPVLVLYVIFSRQLIRGITAGAVK